MKQLIAIILTGMLLCPLKAQLHFTEFKHHERSKHPGSKLIKPITRLKSSNMGNKPTLDSCVYLSHFNSPDTWEKVYKEVFNYDPDGIQTLYTSYNMDSETSQWIPEYKEEVEFNNDGNLTVSLMFEYTEDQFVPTYRYETAYMEDGRISENIDNNYESGVISFQSREVFEYDDNNYISSVVQYSRNNVSDPWVFYCTRKYTVDGMGRITKDSIIDGDVNADGNIDYRDWTKETFVYDAEGNLLSTMYYDWDNELNDWYINSKEECTYNPNSKLLTQKLYQLNQEGDDFVLVWDDEWIYDSNGNNTEYYFREFDIYSEEWTVEKNEFVYDLATPASNYSLPYDIDIECFNKPVSMRYYDEFADPDWHLSDSATFYYSDYIASNANNILVSKVTCLQYLRNLTISWEGKDEFLTFDVYNITGEKVWNQRISNNQTFSLESLPNGIYLYNLSNNGQVAAGKFLLK
jgi:hypothetical protein